MHGVRFGDTERAVRGRHGEPSDDEDGVFPEGSDYTGPPALSSRRRSATSVRRGGRSRCTTKMSPTSSRVAGRVLDGNTRKRRTDSRRRRRGEDLSRIREHYDRVKCGEAVAGESLLGGEPPTYPWCRAIVGDIRVFAGGDPVESITLTRLPPQ